MAIKLAIFLTPFLLAAGFITFIDPYNFLGFSHRIPDSIKFPIARDFNPCFWQLNKFEKNPTENVLLGDSRMAPLDTEVIKEISGEDYTNLGFGGGSIREIIESFWIVAQRVKLKKVFIGINPEKYNDYEITNRVIFYQAAKENIGLYFVNQAVWEAAYYDFYQYLSGTKVDISGTTMSKEDFWKFELEITGKYYQKFAEPKKYREELAKIAEYCKKNNIKLSLIIFPTHVDTQKLIVEANFTEQSKQMREDFSSWGDVYDFDWENDLTRNKENFLDPVHVNRENQEVMIKEIWGNNFKYGRLIVKK